MDIQSLLKAKRATILRLATEHGARNVRVFGSAARGNAGHSSDLDFLVELEEGRSLLDQVALQQALEELLGRPVDVVVEGGISPHLERRILAEALPL